VSGLCGLVFFDGRPVEPEVIQRMLGRIAHRGPHASGVWHEGSVGLGHCALWTTPEAERESLPLLSADGSLAVVSDSRLDNREELLDALGIPRPDGANLGDTALFLSAFEKWGERCVERLLGEFLFVVWDARKRRLLCFRDHFGSRSFCYHLSPRALFFASEAKALLSIDEVPDDIDEARIADYLVGDSETFDATLTCFRAIKRLPPAHVATVGGGILSLSRYWHPDSEREVHFARDEDYEEGFRVVFREAVRCRLRGFPRVGSMLSGGLDSGSIVCVARNILRESEGGALPVVSALSDDDDDSLEAPYARAVIEMGGVDATVVRPSALESFLPDLRRVFEVSDDLFDFNMAGIPLLMYAAARRRGLSALLDGVDGDLGTSVGPPAIGEWVLRGEWARAWSEARGLARFYGLGRLGPQRMIWNHGIRLVAPTVTRLVSDRILGKDPIGATLREAPVAPELARRVDLVARLKSCVSYSARDGFRSARHWQARLLESPILPVALERYDRIAALCSMEPRHPFLDRRIVDYCLALPLDQKLRGGWGKGIVRRSLGGTLPETLRWRSSTVSLHAEFLTAFLDLKRQWLRRVVDTMPPTVREYLRQRATGVDFMDWSASSLRNNPWRIWDKATLVWWLTQRRNLTEVNHA
jgi:asparagine synthase (glutamine-hydrolysing)